MFGRSCARLLVLWLWIVPLALLLAQSDRAPSRPDFSVQGLTDLLVPSPVHPVPRPVAPRLPLSPTPEPGAFSFPQLTRAAGIIFSGSVTGIARHPARPGQTVETIAITFHVESAIRGATAGESLTISEWTGLWAAGQHYRVGERVLLFLYPPSKLGLTSCAAGSLGRFDVDPAGRVLLSAQQLSAFRQDPALGGKSRVTLSDFASAVRQANEEE
ncbi:MAG TPA: hypothetical protein VKV39_00170 [Candidatus Sulfotelmatobacter sp.]|nr:hypothetical protein [Candidatus Sulfotelmatobacter sp.]